MDQKRIIYNKLSPCFSKKERRQWSEHLKGRKERNEDVSGKAKEKNTK